MSTHSITKWCVEHKNFILEELARTMICKLGLPIYFLVDAINTTHHVLNRVVIRPILEKTPYELLKCREPNISYCVFGFK